jgi:hypothetical protein
VLSSHTCPNLFGWYTCVELVQSAKLCPANLRPTPVLVCFAAARALSAYSTSLILLDLSSLCSDNSLAPPLFPVLPTPFTGNPTGSQSIVFQLHFCFSLLSRYSLQNVLHGKAGGYSTHHVKRWLEGPPGGILVNMHKIRFLIVLRLICHDISICSTGITWCFLRHQYLWMRTRPLAAKSRLYILGVVPIT